ncbi:sensor histidine kinase [Gemmobacter serpentinus]|uniref:sensor histidine kinase n=1 Tax=Gemmobacter serpentinus TaxID=2652247 RepID=UPI00124C33DB|nr:HAMP domain-containing sensor histidine kinase [Gemmobacter serpentinus]
MIRHSLKWRLGLAGAAGIITALGLSAIGLTLLFDRHVQRAALAELEARIFTLATMVEARDPKLEPGRLPPMDPRYDQPFSGQYWQVMLGDETRRSRSLWDTTLTEPDAPPFTAGSLRSRTASGPRGEDLLILEQQLLVGDGAQAVPLHLITAMDRATLSDARRGFIGDLVPFLALLAALLVLGSWLQVRVGLRPLAEVSGRVADLTSGARPRIGDDLAREVIPLAREIDTLLDARDGELARARHRSADLAHGFKTPLQALLGDAAQLHERGATDLAESVEHIAMSMQRLVDRELARARIQSDRVSSSCAPALALNRVVEVLRRMPAGAALDWRIEADPAIRARIDGDDLTEALGALLENAMRHARGRVTARLRREGAEVHILIQDDGAGVPEAKLAWMVERGVRLDESGEGHGIGLAIVADIVAAAAGRLRLANRPGGFEAEITIRAA